MLSKRQSLCVYARSSLGSRGLSSSQKGDGSLNIPFSFGESVNLLPDIPFLSNLIILKAEDVDCNYFRHIWLKFEP